MTVTAAEVSDAVHAQDGTFKVSPDKIYTALVVVAPPASTYLTEYEIEAWLFDDEIRLMCHAGYDDRILSSNASASEVAAAIIDFIDDNEKYAV
jgi:hypothetical protein